MVWTKLILLFLIILINDTLASKKLKDSKSDKKRSINDKVDKVDKVSSNTINPESSPCHGYRCGPGQICNVDQKTNRPTCVCVPDCPPMTDSRRKVCSNFNDTWQSDCHLYRHRCLCINNLSEDCLDDHRHMSINYFGECTSSLKCEENTLVDFPRRMREWLYNILTNAHYSVPENKMDDLAHKWVDAVVWKFCDLDREPEDRFVSRHELFPLRAPLLSMEPCIQEFLDKCDSNMDHKITLTEWGLCLGAKEDEIENKCNKFKSIISDEVQFKA